MFIFSPTSSFPQPGVVVVPRPGDFGQRQDVLLQQSRLVPQRPELFPTQQPGVFTTQTGTITQQPGSFFPSPFSVQSPGGTNQPGIFPDASGINLVNTQSSTSPTAAADSVPLIPVRVGQSSYRGVREVSLYLYCIGSLHNLFYFIFLIFVGKSNKSGNLQH